MSRRLHSAVLGVIGFALLLPLMVSGQTEGQITTVPRNVPALRGLAERANLRYQANDARAEAYAQATGEPRISVTEDGQVTHLIGITADGEFIYYQTDNDDAAASTNTDDVYPGGPAGYTLTGSGQVVGEWDGGRTRLSHQEFGTRAIQIDSATTTMSLSNHATHVAGTMVASGVQSAAKGMAYQATLHTHAWDNDDNEMAAAAANGMLMSQHSYGQITGWRYDNNDNRWEWWGDTTKSKNEDDDFGQYNFFAQDWDEIAWNAPYYLICKSAGNDRNDGPSGSPTSWYYGNTQIFSAPPMGDGDEDGGYDCIGNRGNAKNILTIGAVNDVTNYTGPSSVTMSSFSGWGPTDDGRIKPDLVGNGVGLYSTGSSSNTHYYSSSGTSMSGPNVCGSLVLVQQMANNTLGYYIRAASLKGIAIHTAREAGSAPGPDYRFGWGLLDIRAAVEFIDSLGTGSLAFFDEDTLQNGATKNLFANVPTTGDVRITISWTDTIAPTTNTHDDTTRKLMADLDIRLFNSNGVLVENPWILDPANPANAATRGDNNRDNMEQIFSPNLPAGAYNIRISHKGTLPQPLQAYSIMVTGANVTDGVLADFTVDDTSICPGTTVNFTEQAIGGVTTYNWSFPGGNPATSTAQNPTVSYSTSGTYDVELVVSDGLSSDTLRRTQYVRVLDVYNPNGFTETFQPSSSASLPDWFTINPDNGITWQVAGNGPTGANDSAIFMNSYSYSNQGQVDWLYSPVFDFGSVAAATLNFDHAKAVYSMSGSFSNVRDTLFLLVSNNCGASYTTLDTLVEDQTSGPYSWLTTNSNATTSSFLPDTNEWCGSPNAASCTSIDLSAYTGDPAVNFVFAFKNNYQNNLYLDNFSFQVTQTVPKPVLFVQQDSICAGGVVDVQMTGPNIPPSITSFSWTLTNTATGNATTAFGVNASPALTEPGTYDVALIISDGVTSNGDTLAGAVVVSPIPVPSVVATDRTCTDSATVQVGAGGLPNVSYTLREVPSGSPVRNSTGFFTGLTPGVQHRAVIEPLSGCDIDTLFIPGDTMTLAWSEASVSGGLCFGENDLSLQAVLTGGNSSLQTAVEAAAGTIFTPLGTQTGDSLLLQNLAANLTGLRLTATLNHCSIDTSFLRTAPTEILPNLSVDATSPGNATAAAAGGTAPYAYSWNGGPFAPLASLAPLTGLSQVRVSVRDANGCVVSDSGSVTIGRNDPAWAAGLILYPNPASDELTLSLKEATQQNLTLRLTDRLGRELLTRTWNTEEVLRLPVNQLPVGTYTLQLTAPNGGTPVRSVVRTVVVAR